MTPLARKNLIYSLILLSLMGAVYAYRNWIAPSFDTPKMRVSGTAFGVIKYEVKYFDEQGRDFSKPIDSLLQAMNQALSTYIPQSEISRFNQGDTMPFPFETAVFKEVLAKAAELHQTTGGVLDPTILPLLGAWGFGPFKSTTLPDSAKVDSIMQFTGMKHVVFDEKTVKKRDPRVRLDLNALAEGYAIDKITQFLEAKGIEHCMVSIGGEFYCKGSNGKEKGWIIGIDNPKPETGEPGVANFLVHNMSIATSGNYRNFYEKDGKRYAHLIDPTIGHPAGSTMLSATVFAPQCMHADGIATALMVMGKDKAVALLEREGLDGVLVYEEGGQMRQYITEGAKKFLSQ